MPAPVPRPARPFSVMVKPVGSHCNLRCDYCYYLPTPQPGPPRMSDHVLAEFVRQYIGASPAREISFVWHGGEPTLAGLDFYRRAVELQQRHARPGTTCRNNLQTNGVLLDDEWCAFLAEQRFDVGLSLDGTRWLHDHHRPSGQGAGSYQAAADAIGRLQAHGLQPDLLCTVTADSAREPLAVYRNLRRFDTGWIQFIPVVRRDGTGAPTPDSVDGDAYGDFLRAVFDDWVAHDLGRLDVQLFAETARLLAGGAPGLCWLAPTCGRALVVEADGGVYSCDHFVTPAHRLGNLTITPLAELVDSDRQRGFGEVKRAGLAERCRACPWLGLCGGGCPKDRAEGGDEPGLNSLCAGLARFFAHAVPTLEQMVGLTKRGTNPTAVMIELKRQARAAAAPGGSGRAPGTGRTRAAGRRPTPGRSPRPES